MSTASAKILDGLKDTLIASRCRHKWERVSENRKGGKIVNQIDKCGKCGCTRYKSSFDVPRKDPK